MTELIFSQTDDWWLELIGQPASLNGFDTDIAEESIPRSDVGCARVIADKFKNTITYVDKLEQWHVWDGRVHRPLESPQLIKLLLGRLGDSLSEALAYVEEYYEAQAQAILAAGGANAQQNAKRLRDEYRKVKFYGHRQYRDRLFSTAGTQALLTALQTEVTVASDHYNYDRDWLVVENGVIDLSTLPALGAGEFPPLLEHSQARPVTRYFQAEYNPAAGAPSWYTFLSRSLPDVDSRRMLTKVTGAAFMAAPKTKIIPNLQGPPNSGKSLFLETMISLGGGYAVMPNPEALLKVSGTNFYQDELRNMRFVGISEPDEKAQLDDGFVKRVSGGDFTQTRTLHGKPSGWYPQCVMFAASNHAIRFNTRDVALLERVALINFPNTFIDSAEVDEELRMDKDLEEKLKAEASGILNWVVWGMKWYLSEGIEPTQMVIENRRATQDAGSTALQWISEFAAEGWLEVMDESDAAVTPKSSFISVKDAYAQYQIWSIEAGEKFTMSRKFFRQDVERRYGQKVVSGGDRFPRLRWTEQWTERHAHSADAEYGPRKDRF